MRTSPTSGEDYRCSRYSHLAVIASVSGVHSSLHQLASEAEISKDKEACQRIRRVKNIRASPRDYVPHATRTSLDQGRETDSAQRSFKLGLAEDFKTHLFVVLQSQSFQLKATIVSLWWTLHCPLTEQTRPRAGSMPSGTTKRSEISRLSVSSSGLAMEGGPTIRVYRQHRV